MFENIRLAFQGIWSHKMRSFLTMLGIIIGIASIIAIVSTIKGTSEQIKEDLIGSGNNTVQVMLYDGDSTYDMDYGSYGSSAKPPVISDSQKTAIGDLDHVISSTFYYSSQSASVYYKNTSFQGGTVYGIDSNYLKTMGYLVQSGRGFVQKDYDSYRKVALVDSNAAQNIFGSESPVGKTIEVGSEPYIIVGVITQSEDSMPKINTISEYEEYSQTIMGSVMIPDTTWPVAFKFDQPQNVTVRADSTDNMSSVGKAAEDILNTGIQNEKNKSNFKYKAEDIMEKVKNLQKLQRKYQSAADLDRKYLPACWWYRCYEYHACICHRTYQRDRTEKSYRSKKKSDPGTVSDGSFGADQYRRNHWCGPWDHPVKNGVSGVRSTNSHQRSGNYRFGGIFHADRSDLRTSPICKGS